MKDITKLIFGLMLTIGLITNASAASIDASLDGYATYQSDTDTDSTEKKKEGEEEEPDC